MASCSHASSAARSWDSSRLSSVRSIAPRSRMRSSVSDCSDRPICCAEARLGFAARWTGHAKQALPEFDRARKIARSLRKSRQVSPRGAVVLGGQSRRREQPDKLSALVRARRVASADAKGRTCPAKCLRSIGGFLLIRRKLRGQQASQESPGQCRQSAQIHLIVLKNGHKRRAKSAAHETEIASGMSPESISPSRVQSRFEPGETCNTWRSSSESRTEFSRGLQSCRAG